MVLYNTLSTLFFILYFVFIFFPISISIWIPVILFFVFYFFLVEKENIPPHFSLTGIAFITQLAGGSSSPFFISYFPVFLLLYKRGLKPKIWWFILPLFSLFNKLQILPYLILYGALIPIHFFIPKIKKKGPEQKKTKSLEEEREAKNLSKKIEFSSGIQDKIYESLYASVDIIDRVFEPFSIILLTKESNPYEFQVKVAKSKGEIKKKVYIDRGPLSWFLRNSGILVNNEYNDSSTNLGYYKKDEGIKCFAATSIEYENEVKGILVVDRKERIPFEDKDKELLISVAKGLATTTSLYKYMKVSMLEAFRLRYLLDLTGKVAGEIKLEEVRKSIFDTIKNSFKDVWAIFLIKEGGEYLVTEEDGRRYFIKLSKSIVAAALEKNISLCKEDLSKEIRRPILFPEERNFEARSLMFSPFRGDVKGGILLISKNKNWFDRSNDLMILNLITDIAASSVEKAILYSLEKEKAVRDGLTGAYNHRFFQEILDNKIAESHRTRDPLSLLMVDLDNFKLINDQYGHQNGDLILREVGEIMKNRLRASDVLARYGGEEFAIILPKTTSLEAYKLAENLRTSIENKEIFSPDGSKFRVTVSIGVAEFLKHAENKEDLIAAADRALYIAKREGKNQSIIAED
ncbi:MAG: sensor domain-containing diguanylate cyclase [candidate division WOR-3 bacterium]